MVNSMVLQGHLTADIELKRTKSDVPYTEFTVAWSEKYKEDETKCFLRCKAWRGTAEFLAGYFHKGKELVIEGKLVTEQWKADGENKSRTICQVEKVHFCGRNDGGNAGGGYQKGSQVPPPGGFMSIPEGAGEEDLPFN